MILIKNKVSSIPYLSTKSLVSGDAYQAESLLSLIIVIKFQAYKIQLSLLISLIFLNFMKGKKKKICGDGVLDRGFLCNTMGVVKLVWLKFR